MFTYLCVLAENVGGFAFVKIHSCSWHFPAGSRDSVENVENEF